MVLSTDCFFFSSRRRHTRSDRDWSSDVCSSDLQDDHELGPIHNQVFGVDNLGIFVELAGHGVHADRVAVVAEPGSEFMHNLAQMGAAWFRNDRYAFHALKMMCRVLSLWKLCVQQKFPISFHAQNR